MTNDDQIDDSQSDDQNTNAKPGGKQGGSEDESNGFKAITSQDAFDNAIRERLSRERKTLAKDIKAEIEAATRQEEATRQGDFKKLYDELAPKHEEATRTLESATTELETLRGYVNADIEAATKDDAFKPFLRFDPGADAPIADRLKWLKEAKAGIADLPEPTTTRGAGPNPKPAGNHTIDEREEVNRIRARIPQF